MRVGAVRALIPLYVAPSGLPQPGDALVFVLLPIALFGRNRRLDPATRSTIRALWWFTLWVAIVNYSWAVILWKFDRLKDFIIHPFFYLFNALLFFSALVIARRDREGFLRVTTYVCYASIFIQFAASFVYRTDLYRGSGFFNSPNQLGYFALLAACVFALTQRPLSIPRWISGLGIALCAYLAVLSASRSALAGIAILLFILLFANPRMIIIASLVAIAGTTLGGPLSHAIDHAEERSQSLARHGTFAEERGYDRIWNNPEYLVTGAGEGEYQRFVRAGENGRELHSSFGSVLFAYGILGLVHCSASSDLFRVVPRDIRSLRDKAILAAGLSFALAHQGLRFTMFWVVLVVFIVLKQRAAASANRDTCRSSRFATGFHPASAPRSCSRSTTCIRVARSITTTPAAISEAARSGWSPSSSRRHPHLARHAVHDRRLARDLADRAIEAAVNDPGVARSHVSVARAARRHARDRSSS